MTIERANHVWAADITYIPIGRGFLYLVAIIDWASRAVLAWRLSNTMDVSLSIGPETDPRIGKQKGPLGDGSKQQRSPGGAGRDCAAEASAVRLR